MSEKPSFLAELKRCNVYNVAVAYAVVSWLFRAFEALGVS
jgi:hypothetical protein